MYLFSISDDFTIRGWDEFDLTESLQHKMKITSEVSELLSVFTYENSF